MNSTTQPAPGRTARLAAFRASSTAGAQPLRAVLSLAGAPRSKTARHRNSIQLGRRDPPLFAMLRCRRVAKAGLGASKIGARCEQVHIWRRRCRAKNTAVDPPIAEWSLIMKNLFSIAAGAALMLGAAAAATAEPIYEAKGVPITPHQVGVLGSVLRVPHLAEQAPTPTLTAVGCRPPPIRSRS